MADEDSGSAPLDGKTFTEAERKHIRIRMRQLDRIQWLCKLTFSAVAGVGSLITILWKVGEWALANIHFGK